jgi:N-acetyl-gamma-glutamyl-phosphate reductase
MTKARVALIGATGYTGAELLRLLALHPHVEVTMAVARKEVGKPLAELFPHLTGRSSLVLEAFDPDEVARRAEYAFLALPHGTAAASAKPLLERGVRVLDLSADFRLRDPATYAAHYGAHPCPELLATSAYGLVEHHRSELPGRSLVAVPGCYPTAVALAAAPLLRARLASPSRILASCLSGVSGAGREAKVSSLFCEAGEGASAYGVAVHRHQPEMEQELSIAAGGQVTLTFAPHLVPMSRGIHATVAMDLLPGVGAQEVERAFAEAYASSGFVQWMGLGKHPSTAWVRGSNRALIGAALDLRVGRVIVTSVIDNLVKGASGQAVQCLNAVAGFPEHAGLELGAAFP